MSAPDCGASKPGRDLARRRAPLALACLLASAGALAQEAPPRGFTLVPSLVTEGSFVDTRGRLLGQNGTEFVARVSPGLLLTSRSGQLQGSLSYVGTLVSRSGLDDRNATEYLNTLSAMFALEAIPGHGYVDARASISQQAIVATGQPVGDAAQVNSNRTEVTTVSVSPYLRGTLASVVDYELRVAAAVSDSGSATVQDSNSLRGSISLRSANRGAKVGWGLTGQRHRVGFSGATGPTITDRLDAQLSFVPDVDWRLTASGGVESTDVVGAIRRDHNTYGLAVQWTPSPRTRVLLQGDQRYFGRGHVAQFEYRLARSFWRYTDTRDVTSSVDPGSTGESTTLYTLLFAQLASQEPDPVLRETLVRSLIQALGRSPDERVGGGFITAGISLQRRRELALTWQGQRMLFNAAAFRTESRRVDSGGVNALTPNDDVDQSGYLAALAYRVTPQTTATLSGSRTMSESSASATRSDLKMASVALTSQLGRRTSGTLGLRYSVLSGARDAYGETALTGSLSLRF